MSLKKRIPRIVGLTAEIIRSAESASSERVPAITATTEEIKRLWSRDYGKALRSCLSRAEVREIVSEAKRKAWPHLNDEPVRMGSMREFAERASALGADFRIASMPWPSGLAVLGFYLGSDSGFEKRPLICLNGAHHPIAIGTAFIHEVGHHITAKLFSMRDESVQLSRHTGYEAHLSYPRELAADLLVSVGAYPRNMAAKLFDNVRARRIAASGDERLESPAAAMAVLGLARRYGLDLENLPSPKRRQYQAGLIHFTRLRQALLDEYGF
ncbi:MAG TPA: hypothetical protein VE243_03575 [Candidatus Acidoferrum sp.]|nr:hypothetical protein [Candidatus Acidoferrum sp.]